MALELTVNGERTALEGLESGARLAEVVAALGMKADRVAVERNGTIVRRAAWDEAEIAMGDRLEIVHFVGGGSTVSTE